MFVCFALRMNNGGMAILAALTHSITVIHSHLPDINFQLDFSRTLTSALDNFDSPTAKPDSSMLQTRSIGSIRIGAGGKPGRDKSHSGFEDLMLPWVRNVLIAQTTKFTHKAHIDRALTMCEVDFQRARQLQWSFSSLLVEVVWSRTFESLFRAHNNDLASARTFGKTARDGNRICCSIPY
jgi:hypothetical protein